MLGFILALAAAQPVPAAAPIDAEQAGQIRCIAALAIVATEQERGAPGWESYPRLASRGVEWALQIEEAAIAGGGVTRDQFRSLITGEIAKLQAAPAGTRDASLRAVADGCVPLLDAAVPPTGLVQCAAMTELSARAIRGREGLSGPAKDMATIAAVLDHRARESLRAEGRSEAESDRILTLAREAIAGEATADFDLTPCFELAKP